MNHATSGEMLDPRTAHDVAAAFAATPSTPRAALVAAAYAELQVQSDALFAALTRSDARRAVRVVFTRHRAPYTCDHELIAAVRGERVLEVPTAATETDRRHPVLGCERGGAYDRFRAVHDIVGHVRLRVGFDRAGEYTTWRAQDRQYRGLARWALATELHAEHSVFWTTGEAPEHKALLLDPTLLARARAGRRAQRSNRRVPTPGGIRP